MVPPRSVVLHPTVLVIGYIYSTGTVRCLNNYILMSKDHLKEKKTLGKNTVGEIDCDIN